MGRIKPKTIIRQFKLPLEEDDLNHVLNSNNVVILDEKVFQDKIGDITVYLKYESYGEERTKTIGNDILNF